MKEFLGYVGAAVVILTVLGLIVYAGLVIAYLCSWKKIVDIWQGKGHYAFALPFSAIGAFAIVSILGFQSGSDKLLSFDAFGLKFSGPAGPATLWIVCYLSLVSSVKILGK
ncbi:hypothetical protein Mal52_37040 [Symmachiella dynata]|uniref:Uncharacterized protein n=1 Tax=Symmachiella dynata TaxID=2527995 RepID=A0A517ZRZ4_9PLAN|nr:hypothetical protein [Symmachiella dynata]QDU45213.1 hypothetical protein Mal52_37040 [Symmachiella dynata]